MSTNSALRSNSHHFQQYATYMCVCNNLTKHTTSAQKKLFPGDRGSENTSGIERTETLLGTERVKQLGGQNLSAIMPLKDIVFHKSLRKQSWNLTLQAIRKTLQSHDYLWKQSWNLFFASKCKDTTFQRSIFASCPSNEEVSCSKRFLRRYIT